MTDMTYPLFPIVCFVGFIVSLIPLPWHLQAWNSGTCYFMMWAALSCLNQFINSVVWSDNVIDRAPAWCEISIRILMASSVGIPAASLCINRRLYHIANSQTVSYGRTEKFRAILVDTFICVVFPLVFVALQYIVQGHRYNIFEDVGCYPALYNTLLTYFISSMWPLIIGLVSATYCVLSLLSFSRRRLEFSRFMHSNSSSLTIGRYFRLMALAITDILLTTPLSIFTIYLNATVSPLQPWRGWDDTHFGYNRVQLIPAVLWKSNHTLVICLEFTRWMAPLAAVIFFGFFGFADEARKNYRRALQFILKPLNINLEKPRYPSSAKASLGQNTTPKTPISATQPPTPSTVLPAYSPPASSAFYPSGDIKRSDSMTKSYEHSQYATNDLDLESALDVDLGLDTPSVIHISPVTPFVEETRGRSSWMFLSLPFSGRRNSSYF